jgi:hypothetical protein
MTTLTADRAASTFPVYKPSGSGAVGVAWGSIELAANPAAATVIELCRVPAGARVLLAWFTGVDLDTGTEELDIDFGWAANGAEDADTDGFGNMGVLSGDTFATGNLTMEAGLCYMLNSAPGSKLRTLGSVAFTRETVLTALVNVDAAAGGTGRISAYFLYTVD